VQALREMQLAVRQTGAAKASKPVSPLVHSLRHGIREDGGAAWHMLAVHPRTETTVAEIRWAGRRELRQRISAPAAAPRPKSVLLVRRSQDTETQWGSDRNDRMVEEAPTTTHPPRHRRSSTSSPHPNPLTPPAQPQAMSKVS